MLPALTVSRRLPPRRFVLGAAAVVFALAGSATQLSAPPPARVPLSDELGPSSWAMTVPLTWLAGPVPPLRRGERLDLLALRGGDRGYALPIAYATVVVSADERALVLEVTADDAMAIATARAGGAQLIALVRSTR